MAATKVILVKAFFKKLVKPKNPVEAFRDPWKDYSSQTPDVPKPTSEYSDHEVDSDRLATDLEAALNKLNDLGFELKEIVTVTSGKYAYECESGSISSSINILSGNDSVSGNTGYGYGYGYSYTDSLIVVGQK